MNKSTNDNSYLLGFITVFLAGIIWSFGSVLVKLLPSGISFLWQYLFIRGVTISVLFAVYLFCKKGLKFISIFPSIGLPGLIGAFSLCGAFICFISSLMITTAAVALFCVALSPFLVAILAFVFLKENVRKTTLFAMIIAFGGILIMSFGELKQGSSIGLILGFLQALGFAGYTVSLRWKPETSKLATTFLSGFFCMIISCAMIILLVGHFQVPIQIIILSVMHGIIITFGLVLYNIGAKRVAAAEIAVFALIEIVAGIFWVWLPAFGVNEIPSFTSILGGSIILLGIAYHAFGSKKKKAILLQYRA